MLALRLRQISKHFGAFTALDRIDLDVEAGTVHAILGENGAGKTTLMNILYGLCQPDAGTIEVRGEARSIASPRKAAQIGIGMIHQHFMLVDTLSVLENVVLGLPGQGAGLSLARHEARIAEMSHRFGFDIDPRAEVWRLPMGMRQRVEIIKALYRDADIIILDEPTSVLTPLEIDGLLAKLRLLRDAGKTLLLITLKLNEVFEAADRLTVMRRGRIVAERDVGMTDPQEMARLMVGREVIFSVERRDTPVGPAVIEARGLRASGNRGLPALRNVSLTVHGGEIVGVAGVDGNGQAELAEVLTGLREAEAGRVAIAGRDVTTEGAARRRHQARLAFVPEDRHGTGLVLDYPLWKNAILRDFNTARFSRFGFIDRAKAEQATNGWIGKHDVRAQSARQQARFLSGGNQQKLIFAREVECDPQALVVMQPCKGLDVGAIEAVHRTILAEKERGKAILYISTELEHVLAVADRIAVMCAGRIVGMLAAHEADAERIGVLMGGIAAEAEAP